MDIRRAGPCPYQSCWHNHPELPRHWEAAPGLRPEPEPLPVPLTHPACGWAL